MEGVIVLGILNVGLSIWIIKLQNRLAKQHLLIELMQEGMVRVAEGQVRVVRTANGVKFEMVEGV